ncbi:2683_t:CDS:2, partial [Racocetra fulgida]
MGYLFVELEHLKEEIEKENVKKPRRLKTPTSQLPKNVEKFDFSEKELNNSKDFPFNISLHDNGFALGADKFKDLYAEGLLIITNILKKQELIRQNKIKRNKEPVDPTLGAPRPPRGELKTKPQLHHRPLAHSQQPPGHLRAAALNHETIHHAAIPQPVEGPNFD